MKILATGLNGLVGSRIQELLQDKYEFQSISRSTNVNIVDRWDVIHEVQTRNPEIVLHLASKTNVDGCEEDRKSGTQGEAWKVNVEGTRNIVDACAQSNKTLIYISTDFVFDGEKQQGQFYTEEDIQHPINWYGQTKFEAEKIVVGSGVPFVIVRIAYPYRSNFEQKSDFMRVVLSRLKERKPVQAITDHIFSPTFIDDIAHTLDILIQNNASGVYHAVGAQWLSPYDACMMLANQFGLDTSLIQKTTREQFFKDRAPRPFNLSLKDDKIEKLEVTMRSFEEGLKEVKKQIDSF